MCCNICPSPSRGRASQAREYPLSGGVWVRLINSGEDFLLLARAIGRLLSMILFLSLVLAGCNTTTEPEEQVPAPTFTPAGGMYTGVQSVSISCSLSGVTIRYTTDGSDPSANSVVYTEPINVAVSTTIKAQAFKAGWDNSAIASVVYTITPAGEVATPAFDPPGGSYIVTQIVSISCSTSGAVIRYTHDGTEPTANSQQYQGPINVATTKTIKARGFKDGWTPSPEASATYAIEPISPQMVLVFGGTFLMGDTHDLGYAYEQPVHSVTLDSYYISRYEVTQAEYEVVMGFNPAQEYGVGGNYPVYFVSWYSTLKYCNLLSLAEGRTPCYTIGGSSDPAEWGEVPVSASPEWDAVICDWGADGYRLPTEAEWEYAARGGFNYPDFIYSGSDDVNAVAWYNVNSGITTHPVGTKAPNGVDTCDMSGNVWEWCWDWYDPFYYSYSPALNPLGPAAGTWRVHRGCGFNGGFGGCRVAWRSPIWPSYSGTTGFRVCRIYP